MMIEETKRKTHRDIPLTDKEYADLKRALQWPEDLPHYDKVAKPTNLSELTFEREEQKC